MSQDIKAEINNKVVRKDKVKVSLSYFGSNLLIIGHSYILLRTNAYNYKNN